MAGVKLDEAIDQVREVTGARMFVLGEEHTQTSSVKYIRDSLNDLKAKNISTLYIEMGQDMQPLLDKALKGDEASQRDLRMKHERWWFYGGTEAAQERYDLLFDANKAGIRVIAVDMDAKMDHMHRYNQFSDTPGDSSARLAISDPVMARNIQRMDDGGGAVFLVGKNHTYKYDEGGHFENTSQGIVQAYQSQHGGVDQRLNAAGIKTASIDFNQVPDGETFLNGGDELQSDYEINIVGQVHTEAPQYHTSTGYRVYWDRLADIYEHAGNEAAATGDLNKSKQYEKASGTIAGLSKTLDDPSFLKLSSEQQAEVLGKKVENINKLVEPLEMDMQNGLLQEASMQTRMRWLSPAEGKTADQTWKDVVADNKSLHAPEARSLWKRDAMPLAQPAVKPMESKVDGAKAEHGSESKPAQEDVAARFKELMSSNVVGSVKSASTEASNEETFKPGAAPKLGMMTP